MWYFKFILILVFALVLYQDFKNRLVYWFLYPVIGILAFIIQLHKLPLQIAITNLGFNLLFIGLILGGSVLYLKFKNLDFTDMIGLGDVLFFIFIAASFSIVSFLILFVFSLVFSLILHLILHNKKQEVTVPLAGFMSLFFGAVYAISFCVNDTFLYAY
ncbi:general secretion pathway protein [Flavobacterium branchiicola]|uniref:General secretion pathway protein n=1 Tax=Flavobacterium branchiicola TaxID=1114875 RepID=A0ABV9PMP3_9FLAO|nr:general secretion pathway protein [Flavobacterium branchiicola]MBS7256713.1 general secretion pathway protein [Flavobacterium branchiicola]